MLGVKYGTFQSKMDVVAERFSSVRVGYWSLTTGLITQLVTTIKHRTHVQRLTFVVKSLLCTYVRAYCLTSMLKRMASLIIINDHKLDFLQRTSRSLHQWCPQSHHTSVTSIQPSNIMYAEVSMYFKRNWQEPMELNEFHIVWSPWMCQTREKRLWVVLNNKTWNGEHKLD